MSNVLPFIAGVIFFPLIIKVYGNERFGILTLAWSLVGYFTVFDLGFSRALTQMVAQNLQSKKNASNIASLIRTGSFVMLILGILGGFILYFTTPWLVVDVLKISNILRGETIEAFLYLSLLIPVVIHTAALRAVLEAKQSFKTASLIRMFLGVGTFAAPYLTSFFATSLLSAIYALFIIRLIAWFLHFLAIKKSGILDLKTKIFSVLWIKSLWRFAGWMSVSNFIGPLLTYFDRFFIVALLGESVVVFYTAPYEVVTKISVIPFAISSVLFPAFSKVQKNKEKSALVLDKGLLYTALIIYPAALLLCFFSREWLALWLNQDFSEHAHIVVLWLLLGIYLNGFSSILYAKVQGIGRSDWTAKLHLYELVPYIILLWVSLKKFGIEGAAFAWALRILIDLIALSIMTLNINKYNQRIIYKMFFYSSLSALTLFTPIYLNSFNTRALIFAILIFLYFFLFMRQILKDGYLNKQLGNL